MQRPDFRARVRKMQRILRREGMDAFLMTGHNDIYYYTGFILRGDAGFLVAAGAGKPKLFVSPLMNEAEKLRTADAVLTSDSKVLFDHLSSFGSVGFDENILSTGSYMKLGNEVKKTGTRLRPAAKEIKEPRIIKDGYELGQIRSAVGVVGRVLGKASLKGKTELGLAREIENLMHGLGSEPSFPTIVASGSNSAYIHYSPKPRPISRPAIVDLGARVNGYCSDITRSVCSPRNARQRKIYEYVKMIQGEIIDSARDGVPFSELQKIYEFHKRKGGFEIFHSFGHGVGLSVHERPGRDDTLRRGMVITVEPAVYIRGFGGIRIEDMILVRKGRPSVLSEKVRLE
jgi:Xaa-Pro aminopeptidase